MIRSSEKTLCVPAELSCDGQPPEAREVEAAVVCGYSGVFVVSRFSVLVAAVE